jgi:hypothetical protein
MKGKRKTSHTPGPWKTILGQIDWQIVAEDIENTYLVATVSEDIGSYRSTTDNEGEANARLVAAAPDLLEACKESLPSLHWANCHGNRCDEQIVAIEAAIAKAE